MDFMKLIGAVLAVCCHPGYAGKGFSNQRICRRGTEKPCYKIAYHQDSGLRVSFEEARRTCRHDKGELLSIETESEQRLMENFIQDLQASDGDFWIGLQRNQGYTGAGAGDCSAQYYWLDRSVAIFRNWLPGQPSCGRDRCAALYHRPNAPVALRGHYMFRWSDTNCNTKNNFICKYSEEKPAAPSPAGNSTSLPDIPKITQKPKLQPATLDYEKIKTGSSETSVSLSDDNISVYYILLATIPVLLLLILVVSGVFCYRVMVRKRKEPDEIYAEPGQWVSTGAPKNSTRQVPTDRLVHQKPHLEYMSSDISKTFSSRRTFGGQSRDYENVPSSTTGFVTNAIYETCRSPAPPEAGWVDNEIYGY